MKRVVFNMVLAVAALVGVGLLIYPHISFWLAQNNQTQVMQGYVKQSESLDEKTIQEALHKAHEYNAQLTGDILEDPFVFGSGMVLPDEYESILNIGGVMGYVEIPGINVKLPIFHGTSSAVLLMGAGHLEGTSFPVGGESTHTVITAHTGLSSSKMFNDLILMEIGDEFFITVLGKTQAYRVKQIKIVEPDKVEDLFIIEGEDYATLLTCTPYSVNSHRLLVLGTAVPYTPEEIDQRIQTIKPEMSNETLLLLRSIAVLVVLLALALLVTRKKRHKLK